MDEARWGGGVLLVARFEEKPRWNKSKKEFGGETTRLSSLLKRKPAGSKVNRVRDESPSMIIALRHVGFLLLLHYFTVIMLRVVKKKFYVWRHQNALHWLSSASYNWHSKKVLLTPDFPTHESAVCQQQPSISVQFGLPQPRIRRLTKEKFLARGTAQVNTPNANGDDLFKL